MKTTSGYLVKRGRTYYAEWTVGGKRFRQTTHKTVKSEAKEELARILAPFLSGDEKRILEAIKGRLESVQTDIEKAQEAANPPLPLGEAWTAFLASPSRPDTGKATMRVYDLTWGRFWKWMKDNHPEAKAVRDVTPEIAGEFVGWLAGENRSPNTINKYLNLLGLVFRHVKDKARITDNVWDGIARKKLVTHVRRELTVDELRRVCSAAEGDLRLLVAIGIYSGLRLGDACTLRWAECDLVRGRITRVPNKTGRRSPRPVIIPIHATLAAMLAETPAEERKGDVLPRIAQDYRRHASYVTDRVQALFKKCGVETKRTVEGRSMAQVEVGFHSLRHSFVTLCAENKVPVGVVQAMIGHTNPAMTRHYDHAGHDAAKLAAVASLPSIDADPGKGTPAARSPRLIEAEPVRALVERLTAENWQAIKDELLTMTKEVQHEG